MYKNNRRDSGKIKGCSPFQLHRKLKDLSFAVATILILNVIPTIAKN